MRCDGAGGEGDGRTGAFRWDRQRRQGAHVRHHGQPGHDGAGEPEERERNQPVPSHGSPYPHNPATYADHPCDAGHHGRIDTWYQSYHGAECQSSEGHNKRMKTNIAILTLCRADAILAQDVPPPLTISLTMPSLLPTVGERRTGLKPRLPPAWVSTTAASQRPGSAQGGIVWPRALCPAVVDRCPRCSPWLLACSWSWGFCCSSP